MTCIYPVPKKAHIVVRAIATCPSLNLCDVAVPSLLRDTACSEHRWGGERLCSKTCECVRKRKRDATSTFIACRIPSQDPPMIELAPQKPGSSLRETSAPKKDHWPRMTDRKCRKKLGADCPRKPDCWKKRIVDGVGARPPSALMPRSRPAALTPLVMKASIAKRRLELRLLFVPTFGTR